MRFITQYILPAALAMIALGGCGNSDDEPEAGLDYPEFSATIGQASSRAFDQSWEKGDKIGITGCGKSNICYVTTAGTGNFSVYNSDEKINFEDDEEVTFTAYYPWNELKGTTKTISVDTRTQTNQGEFDFLWANEAKGSKEKPSVTFTFSHKMAKLVITIKPAEDISYEQLKETTLSLSGFLASGTFNIETGVISTKTTSSSGWSLNDYAKFNDEKEEITFEILFFPQKFTSSRQMKLSPKVSGNSLPDVTLDFTQSNQAINMGAGQNELVAGCQYNLTLKLSSVLCFIEDCTIQNWKLIDDHDEVDAR